MSTRIYHKKQEFLDNTGIQVDLNHKAQSLRKEIINLQETGIYPQLGPAIRAILSSSISNEFFCSRAESILDRCRPVKHKRESLRWQFTDNQECLAKYHKWIKKCSIELEREASNKLKRREFDIFMDACRAVQNWCAGRSKTALEKEKSPFFNGNVEIAPWTFEEIVTERGLHPGSKSPWVEFCELFDVPAFDNDVAGDQQFLKAA